LLRGLGREAKALVFLLAVRALLFLGNVQNMPDAELFVCRCSTMAKIRFCRFLETPRRDASSVAVFAAKGSAIRRAMNTSIIAAMSTRLVSTLTKPLLTLDDGNKAAVRGLENGNLKRR